MSVRVRWLYLVPLLTVMSVAWMPTGASAGPKPTPTMGMGMGSGTGKPNMGLSTKQVAPAVTAQLKPAGMACGRMVAGGGTVKMIPVHVGMMSGPHVTLVINVHGAGMMHTYSIGGMFASKPPVMWSGTAQTAATDMHGNLKVKTRLMPMLRAGKYKAQIFLRDMKCMKGSAHPVAYKTPVTKITLR